MYRSRVLVALGSGESTAVCLYACVRVGAFYNFQRRESGTPMVQTVLIISIDTHVHTVGRTQSRIFFFIHSMQHVVAVTLSCV
jgi:hypothetical protein